MAKALIENRLQRLSRKVSRRLSDFYFLGQTLMATLMGPFASTGWA